MKNLLKIAELTGFEMRSLVSHHNFVTHPSIPEPVQFLDRTTAFARIAPEMSAAKKSEVIAETGAAPAKTGNGKPTKIELPLHRRGGAGFPPDPPYPIRHRP